MNHEQLPGRYFIAPPKHFAVSQIESSGLSWKKPNAKKNLIFKVLDVLWFSSVIVNHYPYKIFVTVFVMSRRAKQTHLITLDQNIRNTRSLEIF